MNYYEYYKDKIPFNYRVKESSRVRSKFPDKIPAIVEIASNTKDLPIIDKSKFLVPKNLTLGQFIFVIRRRLVLPSEKALFVFINNTLPTTSTLMSEIYNQYVDKDGFLYVRYTSENTFGYKNI